MSRLFVSLYLDEDVDVLVAKLIRSRAFSALTTHDANQLAFAARNRCAILTHNRADFENLARQYLSTGQIHAGIFIAVRRPPYEITRRLLILLNQITADEMDNQTLYL